MDQGPPDTKRPRLSTGPSWSVGGSHHGVSLLHPTPSPTTGQLPHHPPPSTQYQQQHSPLSFARPPGPGDHHHHPPPPPPPPPPHHHPHPHSHPHPHHSPHPHSHHPPHPPPAQTPIDDRRQNEPDRNIPPMQEHRQQPPHSPAHPPYPPYPPREPMIKADPADDPLPQLRRPLSTGGGSAHDSMTPATPHPAIPPPPHSQPYGDDRRHMSFDNGPQPPMYSRQQSYQPQTPLAQPHHYDYPPQYASHGDLPYPIQVAAASGKRKAQRASQACDMCRQLKAKCDELKPCKSCKEKKVECKYREAVPKQQDKIASDILEILLTMRDTIEQRLDRFEQRMSRLEHAVLRDGPRPELQAVEPLHGEHERPDSAASGPSAAAENAGSSTPGDTTTGPPEPITNLEARTITREMEEEKEVEPGPVVRPGVPSIPPNHTTLAATLLKWSSISILVRGILEAENVKYVDEYPIRQEERRGLLRIWGRGEGLESSLRVDKADREAIRDAGTIEMVHDDVSDAGAPSPADCWGGIGGSPAPIDGKPVVSLQTPDFSETSVWKYVKSFQDNIQNMHPLIIPVELKAMVRLFLDTVQQSMARPSRSTGPGGIAKFVGTASPVEATGSKRKRSPGPDGAESPSSPKAKPVFQRSINNALVLLVLALGKICLHKDRIPDVVPVSEPPPHGSPMARNGYPASPIQGSSPSQTSHSHSGGIPSPKDGSDRPGVSRRSSFQGGGAPIKGGTSLKRNLDAIQGLDYFAYATDILGGQLAGTSLRHIYAYLLAGLYHGQLGRVLESYAYIKEAGFALQVKLRPSLDRLSKMHGTVVREKADNRLAFAFWTCLQLESDIIAELPLPQSHILAYEDMMPYPNITLAEGLGFSKYELESYLAQLYLRKSLNRTHGMLYNPEKPPTDGTIDFIQGTLLDMRWVPKEFSFNENDPPAGDILAARLRAKYWGAQVITYRRYVRGILEFNFHKSMGHESTMPPHEYRDVVAPVIGPNNEIQPHAIEYASKGVRGLIESTRAFHGLKEKRFIITNVFGTAHAQWGNLLTLSAVFRDPTLGRFVGGQLLGELFSKTISFFKIIAHPTSALSVDLRILEGLERELWGGSRSINVDMIMDHPTGSSFSSTTSGGPPPPPPSSHVLSSAVAPSMPPVSRPTGIHSPVNHTGNGMMSMSPPLASPLPTTMSGASPPGHTPTSEPGHGGPQHHHPAMLPPLQHQSPR